MKPHALVLLLLLAIVAPALALPTVTIQRCYDGDTCTTTSKEKIRLACIDTPELRGSRADPIPAKLARDYLNGLVAGETVGIRRITKDRYGRTVAELSKNGINVQERLVALGLAKVYTRYASQCDWAKQK
ncbi:thermonuclease family protein [Prochlorococcus sp. MIT 1307]|uniref:thermonuclease family protein n=1 Tax=Prochlorococcus sp. MIT 1307 TaxID=3096219 RepID=UPI002A75516E|nr:thermonuclease family protein [Prochlorococcus sp. MIT 1307]